MHNTTIQLRERERGRWGLLIWGAFVNVFAPLPLASVPSPSRIISINPIASTDVGFDMVRKKERKDI